MRPRARKCFKRRGATPSHMARSPPSGTGETASATNGSPVAASRLFRGKTYDKREFHDDLLLCGEGKVLRLREIGLGKSDALDIRSRVWNRKRLVKPLAAFALYARKHRLFSGKLHGEFRIGLYAHHHAERLPEYLRAERAFSVGRKARHEARVMPEKPHLSARDENKLEMWNLHRGRVEAKIGVDACPDEIVEALPALDHHEAHVDRIAVALHHAAEIRKHRPLRAYGPVVRRDRLPHPEGVHLRADVLDGALHAFHPSDEETWNTAIRIAMATKPTAPAIITIRIGSRALVKDVMLRSMSFW